MLIIGKTLCNTNTYDILQFIFKTFSKIQSIAGLYTLYAFPSNLHNNRNRQTCSHTNFIRCYHFESLNIVFFFLISRITT